MLAYTFLPHLTAVTMLLKLSSNKTIAAASFAIYVPINPIANPTFALFNAGASFVPSPVTATIHPFYLKAVTSKYLSYGLLLAMTFNESYIVRNLS